MPGVWADTITGPSALHVNLGFIPFENYHDLATNGTTIPKCDPAKKIPECFQELLGAYAVQGVTGIRFMFTLNGGYLSDPLDPDKVTAWAQNVLKFFRDAKTAGINDMTIAPRLLGIANDGEFVVEGSGRWDGGQ